MLTRKDLEQRENDQLMSYATRASQSRGRQYTEDEHDMRTAFQRDRARIIHSTAFRRLEYKTQVFVNHEGDHYRTRLTHSLEVAQIAKSIACTMGVNEDLVEAVALSHDLGHPPFGHSGEHALNRLMLNHGGFEHNKQSLRVVDKLEHPYHEFPGLNLSFEVRNCMWLHSSDRSQDSGSEFSAPSPSLEGQIVDIADSLTYAAHDLDDGLRSGILTEAQLADVELWQEAGTQEVPKTDYFGYHKQHSQAVIYITNSLIVDLVKQSEKNIHDNNIKNLQNVESHPKFLIGFSDAMEAKKRELQLFLTENFYKNFKLCRLTTKAERFIETLFKEYTTSPAQMPESFRRWAEVEGLERAVCDYIAGMTDRYAQDEYKNLYYPYERV